MFIRRIAPRSLYSRFLMIVAMPILLVLIVATYMFYERHWSSINRNMQSSLIGELSIISDEFDDADSDKKKQAVIKRAKEYFSFDVNEEKDLENIRVTPDKYSQLQYIIEELLGRKVAINDSSDRQNIIIYLHPDGSTVSNTSVLRITFSSKRLDNPTTYIFMMWIVGSSVFFLLISLFFLRNQVRSIVRLTEAAEKFGREQDMPQFKPQGAKEIRRAGLAFIEMRERIRSLIDRRTKMLAGVSHDLRTPLTRIKLQTAIMRDKETAKGIYEDIIEMERMLDGYLNFVKSESGRGEEEFRTVNLRQFIEGIMQGFRNYNGDKKAVIPSDIMVRIQPDSFRRAIVNFIENALRFGDKVMISAEKRGIEVIIEIADNGPGIPFDKREEVFQPFYRIEASRNKETGGIGLGMSIAREIIHNNGGKVRLDDSDMGGLKVIVSLRV